jgi:hypothetical protein
MFSAFRQQINVQGVLFAAKMDMSVARRRSAVGQKHYFFA